MKSFTGTRNIQVGEDALKSAATLVQETSQIFKPAQRPYGEQTLRYDGRKPGSKLGFGISHAALVMHQLVMRR
jgi:hypothetical protein